VKKVLTIGSSCVRLGIGAEMGCISYFAREDGAACGTEEGCCAGYNLTKVAGLRMGFPRITLLSTGGINLKNVAEYVVAGVDGIVTSSLYNGKPLDIGVTLERTMNE